MKNPHTIKLKFSTFFNVASELDKLVFEGIIDNTFARCLEKIIKDTSIGTVTGQKLSDAFIPLAKKYTGEHGIIQVGKNFYQLMTMTKTREDTSTSHRWKLFQLHGEGYYAQELSSLPNP